MRDAHEGGLEDRGKGIESKDNRKVERVTRQNIDKLGCPKGFCFWLCSLNTLTLGRCGRR